MVMDKTIPKENFMRTQTINLFDKTIDNAVLLGMQYHFHAPSEHSINGQLLDLEMHIVHALEPKYVKGDAVADKSQFTNGVVGVLFKAVPDDFEFGLYGLTDYHDRFLRKMLEAEKNPAPTTEFDKLDLTKFIKMLNYNRRWTFQGSLTTASFNEGILWNVMENVVPIRQSTLDMFLDYRKVNENMVFNQFPSE